MKIRLLIVTFVLSALFVHQNSWARESYSSREDRWQQHSIEITTGYPSLIFDMEFVTLSDRMTSYRPYGKDVKEHYQPGLNIGYTFAWSKRWEVNAMANAHLTSMDILQYPLLDGADADVPDADNYNWDAEPISKTTNSSVNWAFCASVRYKWIVRESFSLYSALGAGVSVECPIPLPYVAPVGVQFGKGRVYGIAELNVSAANTFGMAGIGIRLNK